MTSKEALEKLNHFISREKHIDSEHNKTINECINIIQQDLECKEQLEKEIKIYRYIIKNGKASRGRYKLLIDWNNNYTVYEFIKGVLGNDK